MAKSRGRKSVKSKPRNPWTTARRISEGPGPLVAESDSAIEEAPISEVLAASVRSEDDTAGPIPEAVGIRRASMDEIRARAYEIYLARAGSRGNAKSDWLAAERQLSISA